MVFDNEDFVGRNSKCTMHPSESFNMMNFMSFTTLTAQLIINTANNANNNNNNNVSTRYHGAHFTVLYILEFRYWFCVLVGICTKTYKTTTYVLLQ